MQERLLFGQLVIKHAYSEHKRNEIKELTRER